MEATPIITSEDEGEGRSKKTYFDFDSLDLRFRTVLKVPDLRGASSIATVRKNPDNTINDVRVNPDSPDNPKQLTMFQG